MRKRAIFIDAISGFVRLGGLVAQVPNTAGYKAKELLHLANIQVNSGAIPAINDDGIHVVAYLGDTAPADLSLTTPDAVYVNRLYQVLLGRPVDAGGLAAWTSLLTQGLSRSAVVQAARQRQTGPGKDRDVPSR